MKASLNGDDPPLEMY